MAAADPHSFANIDELITRHLSWNVETDFSNKILFGTTTLTLEALVDGVKTLTVDTKDGLKINKATQNGKELQVLCSLTLFAILINCRLLYVLSTLLLELELQCN